MKRALYIGIAGAIGAILRTAIAEMVGDEIGFPFATLFVNILGSFLLCLLVSKVISGFVINSNLKVALQTGFLGSFTTLSAFSMETVHLLEDGQLFLAFLYVSISLLGGLSVGVLGFSLGRKRRIR